MTSLPKLYLPIPVVPEFLDSVAAIYQDLLSGKNPNTVIVPTSSSGQHRQRPILGDAGMLDGVEASLFYQRLENLCDRHKYRWDLAEAPPTSAPGAGSGCGSGNKSLAIYFDWLRVSKFENMAICPQSRWLTKGHFHQAKLAVGDLFTRGKTSLAFLERKHLLFQTFPQKGKVKLRHEGPLGIASRQGAVTSGRVFLPSHLGSL